MTGARHQPFRAPVIPLGTPRVDPFGDQFFGDFPELGPRRDRV
jgi:hypothetical protein